MGRRFSFKKAVAGKKEIMVWLVRHLNLNMSILSRIAFLTKIKSR